MFLVECLDVFKGFWFFFSVSRGCGVFDSVVSVIGGGYRVFIG